MNPNDLAADKIEQIRQVIANTLVEFRVGDEWLDADSATEKAFFDFKDSILWNPPSANPDSYSTFLNRLRLAITEKASVDFQPGDDPFLLQLIRREFTHPCVSNDWLLGHSLMEKRKGLDTSRMTERSVNRNNVQSAVHEGDLVYAVPESQIEVRRWVFPKSHPGDGNKNLGSIGSEFQTLEPTYSQLIGTSLDVTQGRQSMLIFRSKEDALAFAVSTATKSRTGEVRQISPIISMVHQGPRLELSYRDFQHTSSYECADARPNDCVVLGVEAFLPDDTIADMEHLILRKIAKPFTKLKQVFLKTPFDAPKPPKLEPVSEDMTVVAPVKMNQSRHQAHKKFMATLTHTPCTVNDLRHWLREVYLPLLGNAPKATPILEILNDLDAVEKMADFGRDLTHFLEETGLAQLIKEHREGNKPAPTWGWKTINESFLHPTPAKMSRFNRDEQHERFMKSIENHPPQLNDVLNWIEDFYCNQYLPSQKNGEDKKTKILKMVENLRTADNIEPDIQLKEFFDQYPDLAHLLKETRRKEHNKETWGWSKIEESFLGPEREASATQRINH